MGVIEDGQARNAWLLEKLMVNIPLQLKALDMPVGVSFLKERIAATPLGEVHNITLGDALCSLVREGEINFTLVGDDVYFSA